MQRSIAMCAVLCALWGGCGQPELPPSGAAGQGGKAEVANWMVYRGQIWYGPEKRQQGHFKEDFQTPDRWDFYIKDGGVVHLTVNADAAEFRLVLYQPPIAGQHAKRLSGVTGVNPRIAHFAPPAPGRYWAVVEPVDRFVVADYTLELSCANDACMADAATFAVCAPEVKEAITNCVDGYGEYYHEDWDDLTAMDAAARSYCVTDEPIHSYHEMICEEVSFSALPPDWCFAPFETFMTATQAVCPTALD